MSKEAQELIEKLPSIQANILKYIEHLENERQLVIASQLRILLQVSEEYIQCLISK